jgi:hypothetical protein
MIAFFMRSGFGEPLLLLVIEMVNDVYIMGNWFHDFVSVIVAFAANGTNEATVALLQAVLARADSGSCHFRMDFMVVISALLIVDRDRTLKILDEAGITLQAIVVQVASLFGAIWDVHVERRFIIAGPFQFPNAAFQIAGTAWTTAKFVFWHLLKYARLIYARKEVNMLGIDETERRLTKETFAFELRDQLYVQNAITDQSFSDMAGILLAGVKIP